MSLASRMINSKEKGADSWFPARSAAMAGSTVKRYTPVSRTSCGTATMFEPHYISVEDDRIGQIRHFEDGVI